MPHVTTLPLHSARRLWQAFLSARVLVATLLIALQVMHTWSATELPQGVYGLWPVTAGYFILALLGWLLLHQKRPASYWRWPWLLLLGADVLTICLLQELQIGKMHYTPLLALPILTVSVLGPMRMALATTASITLILLGIDIVHAWSLDSFHSEVYMQTALVCAGFFAVAYLTRQLAQRLTDQERQAHTSRQAARLQAQVNGLIIDNLSEGVLVLDNSYQVRMANPAASELMGVAAPLALHDLRHHDWQALRDMVDQTFASTQALSQHIHLMPTSRGPTSLFVRTWLTTRLSAEVLMPEPELAHDAAPDSILSPHPWLCVMFLHDLREMEARLRTEKMAAMGRMSAAVAHEIRNPLAAIVQANALLAEALTHPAQQRLSHMVEHNAQRLARIAEDVLDIARVQQQLQHSDSRTLVLDAELSKIWQEWRLQNTNAPQCAVDLKGSHAYVAFDSEHLRRVVVNLLDNASRHCQSRHDDALQLSTGAHHEAQVWLQVWSEGPPLEASVQKHLFEPFFSSQSRSSGLGLFICRELCQRYGASIHYSRTERLTTRGMQSGNAFTVHLRSLRVHADKASLFDAIVV